MADVEITADFSENVIRDDGHDSVDVDEAIHNLKCAIAEVDRALQDDASLEDRAGWLRALEWRRDDEYGAYQQLAFVIAGLKRQMAPQLKYGEDAVVEGVGVLTYTTSGGKTVWNGMGLAAVLAAQLADEAWDRQTGERVPPAIFAERVAAAFVDCAGLDTPSKSWRKTNLRARGIDPAPFVETEGGEKSVRWK